MLLCYWLHLFAMLHTLHSSATSAKLVTNMRTHTQHGQKGARAVSLPCTVCTTRKDAFQKQQRKGTSIKAAGAPDATAYFRCMKV